MSAYVDKTEIEFLHGTIAVDEIDGLFVTDDRIPYELASDLSVVKIMRMRDGVPTIEVLHNQKIVVHRPYDNRFWFSLTYAIPMEKAIIIINDREIEVETNNGVFFFNEAIPEKIYPKIEIVIKKRKTLLENVKPVKVPPYELYSYRFSSISKEEIRLQQIESDIQYIFMMSDI